MSVIVASSAYSRFDPHPSPLPRGDGDRRYRPGTRINRSQEARCCPVKIRLDWCHVFSYQSPMPAGAGTPRYENWVHRSIEGFRCRLCPHPTPWLGTSPSPTFLSCDPGLSLFGRRWLVSPAGAGTPSVENWVRSLVDVFERHCCLEPLFPL